MLKLSLSTNEPTRTHHEDKTVYRIRRPQKIHRRRHRPCLRRRPAGLRQVGRREHLRRTGTAQTAQEVRASETRGVHRLRGGTVGFRAGETAPAARLPLHHRWPFQGAGAIRRQGEDRPPRRLQARPLPPLGRPRCDPHPGRRRRGGARPVPRPHRRLRGAGESQEAARDVPAAQRLDLRRQDQLDAGAHELPAQTAHGAPRPAARARGVHHGGRCRGRAGHPHRGADEGTAPVLGPRTVRACTDGVPWLYPALRDRLCGMASPRRNRCRGRAIRRWRR